MPLGPVGAENCADLGRKKPAEKVLLEVEDLQLM